MNKDGIFLVYDLSCKRSFESVIYWIGEIIRTANRGANIILIGNKSDAVDKREVSYEEGKELADSLGIPFIEISAETGDNVELAFSVMVNEIWYKHAAIKSKSQITSREV